MDNMYNIIENLCKSKGITVTEMCRKTNISRGSLTDLKANRSKSLSQNALSKIADYFDVSTDYLLRGESDKQSTDEDIKFALFNGSEGVTDEMFEEVKRFAEMVKLREEAKKNK